MVLGGAGSEQADGTVLAQAGLLVVQVGLARLLASWGLVPDAVAGHSVGEVAAAQVAGLLPLSDACALMAARGQLMAGLPAGGAMAAIAASEQEVAGELADAGGLVAIAAVNGPSSVVVSGDRAAVAAVIRWEGRGRRVRWLRVSHAFHSPLMDPVRKPGGVAAGRLDWSEPRVPVVSGLTGGSWAPGGGGRASTGRGTRGGRCGSPTRSGRWRIRGRAVRGDQAGRVVVALAADYLDGASRSGVPTRPGAAGRCWCRCCGRAVMRSRR